MFMLTFFWFLLLCEFRYITCLDNTQKMPRKDERYIMGKMMVELSSDVIKNQNEKLYNLANDSRAIEKLYEKNDNLIQQSIRQDHAVSAPFEIGYMTQMIQEHYRRMLDKWRSTKIDIKLFYNIEVTLFLEEIEHLYWSIKHEVYMLHEIERKYKITSPLNGSFENPQYKDSTPFPTPPSEQSKPRPKPKRFNKKKFMANAKNKMIGNTGGNALFGIEGVDPEKLGQIFEAYTTRKPKTTYFPRDYGWDLYEWNSDT